MSRFALKLEKLSGRLDDIRSLTEWVLFHQNTDEMAVRTRLKTASSRGYGWCGNQVQARSLE